MSRLGSLLSLFGAGGEDNSYKLWKDRMNAALMRVRYGIPEPATPMSMAEPEVGLPSFDYQSPQGLGPALEQGEVGITHPAFALGARGTYRTAGAGDPLGAVAQRMMGPAPIAEGLNALPLGAVRSEPIPERMPFGLTMGAGGDPTPELLPTTVPDNTFTLREAMERASGALGRRNAASRLRIANRMLGAPRHEGLDYADIPLTRQERFDRLNVDTPWQPNVMLGPERAAPLAQVDPADIDRGLQALALARTKRMLYGPKEGHQITPLVTEAWEPGDPFTSRSAAPLTAFGEDPTDATGRALPMALPHISTTAGGGPVGRRAVDPTYDQRRANVIANAMARRQARQLSRNRVHPMLANPWARLSMNPTAMIQMLGLQQQAQSDMMQHQQRLAQNQTLGSYYGGMVRNQADANALQRRQAEWAMSKEGIAAAGLGPPDKLKELSWLTLQTELAQPLAQRNWSTILSVLTKELGYDMLDAQRFIMNRGGPPLSGPVPRKTGTTMSEMFESLPEVPNIAPLGP